MLRPASRNGVDPLRPWLPSLAPVLANLVDSNPAFRCNGPETVVGNFAFMAEGKSANGRQQLIEATLESFANYGYHGSSVRKITSRAGVAVGLVQHHFNGKAELIRESYRHFRRSAVMTYISEAEDAGPDPVERLEAFVRTIFHRRAGAGRRLMKIWISFLELVITDPEISRIQSEVYDLYIEELSECIEAIFADKGEPLDDHAVRRVAIGIYSLVDGLWLECALNPTRMTPDDALEIALSFTGARMGISFSARAHGNPCPPFGP